MGEVATQEVVAGRRHIIRRPRLTRLLDECEARIILLVAPAGYGKTTLAREWVSATRTPIWLDARPAAADLAALAASIAACAGKAVPDAGKGVTDRLRATSAPRATPELLAELLVSDLEHWPSSHWLVVDDYHHIAQSADAESFVGQLTRSSRLNMLILARQRPKWATPRRLLYGEIFELGKSMLAMDSDEARAVLATRQRASLPGLVALAEGWPAVIGLAALGPRAAIPPDEIPTQLYDFFAEEIYLGLSPDARRAVSALSIAPKITDAVATTVLGASAKDVLGEAVAAGFLTQHNAEYEFHPLLRDFIRRRIPEAAEPASVTPLIELHLAAREWDEAFSVAVAAGEAELVALVVERSLDHLLNEGRLETLRAWIDTASDSINSALLELAEGEIAFRNAKHEQAFVLTSRAAKTLAPHHPLRARALLSAAQAAYFADRTSQGRRYSDMAAKSSQSDENRADALWLSFTASTELEDRDLVPLLDEFEKARTDRPEDAVRAACGHLIIDIRFGENPQAARYANGARGLVDRVADPIVRASFFNLLGRSSILRGWYEEASNLFILGEDIAAQARLDFAVPHLLMAHALAELGRQRLKRATQLLNRAQPFATDAHTMGNDRLIRGKILLADGRVDAAMSIFAERRAEVSDRATLAELFAYGAFAAAVSGDTVPSIELASRALATSRTIEPYVVGNLALALANGMESAEGRESASAALSRAGAAEHVDLLVLPFRIAPHMIHLVEALPAAATRTVGAAIAHVEQGRTDRTVASLSRREREVLELIAEGLSNREIAARLYISDVTVKVHVRHIFEKLGVRSRTEAALIAVEDPRYAAGASNSASRA